MLFSYYFDVDKTHLLNCRFRVLDYVENTNGTVDIQFFSEISESINGVLQKREEKKGIFHLPVIAEGPEMSDIEFVRIRHSGQRKWVFTVVNGRNSEQKSEIGLITTTANKNPLGMDVIHEEDDEYEVDIELRDNRLSILEPTFVPPILTQTVATARFDSPVKPKGFTSETGTYDELNQAMHAREFKQTFLETIPARTRFSVSLDIAPKVVTPAAGETVLSVKVGNFGEITMTRIALEFMIAGGMTSDIRRSFFGEVLRTTDFWEDSKMKSKARMTIDADGIGNMAIKYNDTTVNAVYDPSKEFSFIAFKGGIA